MPIIINNFKWKQSHDMVTIQVPLKVHDKSKTDVFITPRYIKVSYEKYFFEAILTAEIDQNLSKCTLTANEAIFDLRKREHGEWESLEPKVSKEEKLKLKKALLEDSYNWIQKDFKEKLNKRAELKRVAVRQQIETDTKQREEIDTIRKRLEMEALGNITSWGKVAASMAKNRHRQVLDRRTNDSRSDVVSLRTPKTLEVDFTPREFPTPCRESKIEEENEWLAKQAEARRSAGFISDDIRPEERNPQFLKAKGDEFMRNKNYLGAISAYSFGIKLSSGFVDLYIGRAEAHMALGKSLSLSLC